MATMIKLYPVENMRPVARDVFDRLMALRSNAQEISDLKAAGVAQRRIDVLYPYDFAELIPAIHALITVKSFKYLMDLPDEAKQWNEMVSKIRWRVDGYPQFIRDQLNADHRVVMEANQPAYDELHARIRACLPESSQPRLAADSALYGLMNTCWFMARAKAAEAAGRELSWDKDDRMFLNVVNCVIPTLRSEKYALTQASVAR